MQELLTTLLQAVITVATPILAAFAVRWFKAKTEQAKQETDSVVADKYITEATDAISTAVLHTAQTYTDALKKSGTFTADNQKEAFNMAISEAKKMLTADARKFIEMAYGDLTSYLTPRIEAEVKLRK